MRKRTMRRRPSNYLYETVLWMTLLLLAVSCSSTPPQPTECQQAPQCNYFLNSCVRDLTECSAILNECMSRLQ